MHSKTVSSASSQYKPSSGDVCNLPHIALDVVAVGPCRSWYPYKHEEFIQCCFNVGPASKTVAQYWNDIEWMLCVCWDLRQMGTSWWKKPDVHRKQFIIIVYLVQRWFGAGKLFTQSIVLVYSVLEYHACVRFYVYTQVLDVAIFFMKI